MKILWEEMQPHEFVEAIEKCPVAYLPLGTLEWHGFHMPLGADGIQSQGLFEKVAGRIGGVVMPKLFLGPDKNYLIDGKEYYGMDMCNQRRLRPYEVQQLIGSAYWIDGELFDLMILQICKNVSRAGIKILVGHGHGPSINRFMALKEKALNEYNLVLLTAYDFLVDDLLGYQNDHAAANETSITWALREDLVDMNKCSKDEDLLAMIGRNPIEYASKEYGQEIIDANVEALCKGILERL